MASRQQKQYLAREKALSDALNDQYLLGAHNLRQAQASLPLEHIQTAAQRLLIDSLLAYIVNGQDTDYPPEHLGRLYEQVLAIRLVEDGQRILLQHDRSLRQRAGNYYTPLPVVRFLVNGTVGCAVRGIQEAVMQHMREKQYVAAQTAIETLKTLKVLDLACGGGIFLVVAYELLVQAYHWWNELVQMLSQHEETFQATGLRQVQTPEQTVLQDNIFGVDCDPQAVEVAKASLALSLLRTSSWNGDMPDLSKNIGVADALTSSLDIDAFLGTGTQTRFILGNPPWGADLSPYGTSLRHFELARGRYDSYELFIEQATRFLRPGDVLGYVVPDSILHLPEHARLRDHLLRNYSLNAVVKLGEGVFEDVFRGAVAFQGTRTDTISASQTVRCHIVVKQERHFVLQNPSENVLQVLLDRDGIAIAQTQFNRNKEKVFDLCASYEDRAIIERIEQNALNWREVVTTGRGVEVAKSGAVMACPFCGSWQNIPRKRKNGTYAEAVCVSVRCRQRLEYDMCQHATIIASSPSALFHQPMIVGESINRYQILETRYLDLSRGKSIKYKFPLLYAGEKLLVRKTGRGIYATIDRTGAYTNQVVFMFKLKKERPAYYERLRLSYILGVLNSRMMLYRYYKALGDVEWKSFPYMTQDTIMGLPIRTIDFLDARQASLHDRIADAVDSVLASGQPPTPDRDREIEQCVRALYGVNGLEMSTRIDAELERISTYGSLLGSRKNE